MRNPKKNFLILAFIVYIICFSFNCSLKPLLDSEKICPGFIFPRSFVFSISGHYQDEDQRQRFEALVYFKEDKMRFEILNMMGFAEVIMIYNNDALYIENRRDNITEIYEKHERDIKIFGFHVFLVHPLFLMTGHDINLRRLYEDIDVRYDFSNDLIQVIPYDHKSESFTLKRRLNDREAILFKASNPEIIGNCLFFKTRNVEFRDNRLKYNIEAYNLNIDLGDQLFKW